MWAPSHQQTTTSQSTVKTLTCTTTRSIAHSQSCCRSHTTISTWVAIRCTSSTHTMLITTWTHLPCLALWQEGRPTMRPSWQIRTQPLTTTWGLEFAAMMQPALSFRAKTHQSPGRRPTCQSIHSLMRVRRSCPRLSTQPMLVATLITTSASTHMSRQSERSLSVRIRLLPLRVRRLEDSTS